MTDSVHRTARDLARREISRAIIEAGRRQLSEVGPSELSLRAVARELGMVSSAVYRYVPSRDDLLTLLMVQIYTDIADALEAADAAVRRRSDFRARWQALAECLHQWARSHPHDYALVYGSPIPGYAAPQDTVAPSGRVTGMMLRLLIDAHQSGQIPPPQPVPRAVHRSMTELRAATDHAIPDDLLLRGVQAWGGLLGAINLELFGHLQGAIADHDAYFSEIARRLSPL